MHPAVAKLICEADGWPKRQRQILLEMRDEFERLSARGLSERLMSMSQRMRLWIALLGDETDERREAAVEACRVQECYASDISIMAMQYAAAAMAVAGSEEAVG